MITALAKAEKLANSLKARYDELEAIEVNKRTEFLSEGSHQYSY
jgi:hypothetical protein